MEDSDAVKAAQVRTAPTQGRPESTALRHSTKGLRIIFILPIQTKQLYWEDSGARTPVTHAVLRLPTTGIRNMTNSKRK